jgi:hypothetical protein
MTSRTPPNRIWLKKKDIPKNYLRNFEPYKTYVEQFDMELWKLRPKSK